jgi:hypothetical protein
MAELRAPWWRRPVTIYNAVYLAATLGWMAAWWFLGVRTWAGARYNVGFLIFFQFAWVPFGAVQLLIIQGALKAEIERLGEAAAVLSEEFKGELARIYVLAEAQGIDLDGERPTLQ